MIGSWHQQQAFKRNGPPQLQHDTKWTCYPSSGFLSLMRFDKREDAETYSKNTGESICPPKSFKG